MIGCRLIDIPDARPAVDFFCKKLCSFFAGNPLPDFDRIFISVQCENRDRNFIGANGPEIHPGPRNRRLPVAGGCNPLFIAVSNLSDDAGVQTGRNKTVRVQIGRSKTFHLVLQLRNQTDMLRPALRGCPKVERPISQRGHRHLISVLRQLNDVRCNTVVIHRRENNLMVAGSFRSDLSACPKNSVLRIKDLSVLRMENYLADRNRGGSFNRKLRAVSSFFILYCISCRCVLFHNCKKLSGEEVSLTGLIAVIIRAVSVVESEKSSASDNDPHTIRRILHRISVCIHGTDFIEMKRREALLHKLHFLRSPELRIARIFRFSFLLADHEAVGISEGMPRLTGNFFSVLPGNRSDFARHIGNLPVCDQMRTAPLRMIQLLSSEALPVDEKFHLLCVRADAKIDLLTDIKIPVRENMHHRICPDIGPCGLPDIVGILREAGGINDSKIGILRVIGRRLSDVIKAGPEELSHGEIQIPVNGNTSFHALCAPACHRVSECRALLILIRKDSRPQREVINAAACADGACLRSVNDPVRVLFMMIFVIFLRIVVSGNLIQLRAVLRIFPRHVVGAGRDAGIPAGIQRLHLLHQKLRYLVTALIRMLVINFVSDAPENHAGVIAVSPDKALHVPCLPLIEKAGIVKLSLSPLPHIEGFVHDKKSHLIRKIQRFRRERIVRKTDGVDTHLLLDLELPPQRIQPEGGSECSLIRVLAGSVDLHPSSVQKESLLRVKGRFAEADPEVLLLQQCSVGNS